MRTQPSVHRVEREFPEFKLFSNFTSQESHFNSKIGKEITFISYANERQL